MQASFRLVGRRLAPSWPEPKHPSRPFPLAETVALFLSALGNTAVPGGREREAGTADNNALVTLPCWLRAGVHVPRSSSCLAQPLARPAATCFGRGTMPGIQPLPWGSKQGDGTACAWEQFTRAGGDTKRAQCLLCGGSLIIHEGGKVDLGGGAASSRKGLFPKGSWADLGLFFGKHLSSKKVTRSKRFSKKRKKKIRKSSCLLAKAPLGTKTTPEDGASPQTFCSAVRGRCRQSPLLNGTTASLLEAPQISPQHSERLEQLGTLIT